MVRLCIFQGPSEGPFPDAGAGGCGQSDIEHARHPGGVAVRLLGEDRRHRRAGVHSASAAPGALLFGHR